MFTPLRRVALPTASTGRYLQKRAYSDQLDIEGFLSRISNVIENSRKPAARTQNKRPRDDQNKEFKQRPRVQTAARQNQPRTQKRAPGPTSVTPDTANAGPARQQPRKPYIRLSSRPANPAVKAPQWGSLEPDAKPDGKPEQTGNRRRGRSVRRPVRRAQKPLITATRPVEEIPPLLTPDEAYNTLARNVGTSLNGYIPEPDVSLLSLKNDLKMIPVNSQTRLFIALQHKPQSEDLKSFTESKWFKTNVAGSYSGDMLKTNSAVAKLISLNPAFTMNAKRSLADRIDRRV